MSAVVHMDQTGNQRWDYFLAWSNPWNQFYVGNIFHIFQASIYASKIYENQVWILIFICKTILIHSYVDQKCHFLDVPQIVELGSLKTWKTECKKDLVIFVWLRRDCKLILWTHRSKSKNGQSEVEFQASIKNLSRIY